MLLSFIGLLSRAPRQITTKFLVISVERDSQPFPVVIPATRPLSRFSPHNLYLQSSIHPQAISSKMVFVLRYPLLDYLPAMPDIMESRPHRKMWDPTSPITFFAVHPNNRNNLIPIAIQMDVKPGMNILCTAYHVRCEYA